MCEVKCELAKSYRCGSVTICVRSSHNIENSFMFYAGWLADVDITLNI